MTSGSAATHGAGPSGHSTAARMLSTAIAKSSKMDIDTLESPPTTNDMSEPHDGKATNHDMIVDESSSSNV